MHAVKQHLNVIARAACKRRYDIIARHLNVKIKRHANVTLAARIATFNRQNRAAHMQTSCYERAKRHLNADVHVARGMQAPLSLSLVPYLHTFVVPAAHCPVQRGSILSPLEVHIHPVFQTIFNFIRFS